jgi:EthR-like transcriptional regulator
VQPKRSIHGCSSGGTPCADSCAHPVGRLGQHDLAPGARGGQRRGRAAQAAAHHEDEQAAGRTSPHHPHATAFALVWMTERTLYQQFVQGEPVPPDDLVEEMVGIWLRSLYTV